jgi:tetratricopeptide (TPR) repeat protein
LSLLGWAEAGWAEAITSVVVARSGRAEPFDGPLWEAAGERGTLSTFAGGLANTLAELDRLDEAEHWAGRSAGLGSNDDVATQTLWRQAQAKVHARRGELAEAEQLAREAVSVFEGSDDAVFQLDAWLTLGEILSLDRTTDDAQGTFEEALNRYER